GSARAQAVARSGQEAAALQRPRHCARQQARLHCLERPGSWSSIRGNRESSRVISTRVVETSYLPRSARGCKRDGGSVFPAHANSPDFLASEGVRAIDAILGTPHMNTAAFCGKISSAVKGPDPPSTKPGQDILSEYGPERCRVALRYAHRLRRPRWRNCQP